jgi:hypothetical protein
MGDMAAKVSGECGIARAIDIDGDDAARELADGTAELCISQNSVCKLILRNRILYHQSAAEKKNSKRKIK